MAEENDNVRVLSNAEKNSYEGVTIDADSGEAENRDRPYHQESDGERPRYYRVYSGHSPFFRGLSLTSLLFGTDWRTRLVRIAALVGVAAIAVLFISFILPVLVVVAGAAVAFWLIQQLLH